MSLLRLPSLPLRLVLLVATVLLVAAPPLPADAAGQVFHVAPDGDDDGAGTEADPWRTIFLAMQEARAGDTLLLHGGRYDERIGNVKPLPKGTPEAPITLRNAPGETPVIVGGMTLQLGGPHHWVFDGLTFAWSDALGKNAALVRIVDGVGWEIRNSTIAGNRSYAAVRVLAETKGLATDWTIRDSCIHTTYATNATNNDHNVYIGADSRNGIAPGPGLIEGNIIAGAPNGANIKLAAGESHLEGTHGVVVRGNVMAGAPQNVIIAWRSHDNVIEDNALFQRPNGSWSQPWYPNVRGLELSGSGNVARGNVGFASGGTVVSWDSTTEVADDGNTAIGLDPGDTGTPCADLAPLRNVTSLVGPSAEVDRLAGDSRVQTAAQLSEGRTSDTVIIARADAYADALAAAPLAGHLDAPLLLTAPDHLSPETRGLVRSTGASRAYLMGGPGAVGAAVEQELADLGLDVERVAGADRFATAAAVIALLPTPTSVFVVEGANPSPTRGWPDAVALSPLAASTAQPILLTTRDSLPDATRAALRRLDDDVEVLVIGGEVAVSDAVAGAIEATASQGTRPVTRVAGTDRYATAARVAQMATTAGSDPQDVWLVTGLNWPDALAAGPAATAAGATMLLVHGQDARHSPAVLSWLQSHADPTNLQLTVVGGNAAVSPTAVASLAYGLG